MTPSMSAFSAATTDHQRISQEKWNPPPLVMNHLPKLEVGEIIDDKMKNTALQYPNLPLLALQAADVRDPLEGEQAPNLVGQGSYVNPCNDQTNGHSDHGKMA
ncbi:hypothetical protein DSO57_1000124 [Entomophthora muscae]|uniref:Uncharacterized protein n=1 Tax=Entomophthora muscae TaxID=34485 RepID=A0ACC2SMZ7_9FUNG|nr:hypothetical protein DSO57_1000124 [Entomophthora muscae]